MRVSASALVLASGLLLAACPDLKGEPMEQPLAFNHAAHQTAEVDCLACHEGVFDYQEPNLPALEICVDCHAEDDDYATHPVKAQLKALADAEGALEWASGFGVIPDIRFSHERHIDGAELECGECHGDMPSRTEPPARTRPLGRQGCTSCHGMHPSTRTPDMAIDCLGCHG